MAGKRNEDHQESKFQKVGIMLAGAFYVVAVIYVHFLGHNAGKLDPSVTTLTVAHWQLEDGFREGFDKVFRSFEKMKAEQGVKVKIIQSTVPVRGYKQWFLTQLIGGNPADIIELNASSPTLYRYFTPLSPYVGKPNPYNDNEPKLKGVPWKDTFVDGMEAALDATYAEYFGVGMCFFNMRLHVNVELYKDATGTDKLPTDLPEWLDACQKIKEYAEKKGEPISPIGVRGFDKSTLGQLFSYYFGQLNGNINDKYNETCSGAACQYDVLKAYNNGKVSEDQITAVAEIIRELGQYFSEGFTAIDLEQTKYMFYAGKVVFFPEGSWNSYSMVKNTPFKVAIIPVPVIGHKHKFSKYYTGPIAESGVGLGCRFGIPKACDNFDLALELLQYLTCLEQNQVAMDECKWLPGVKHAEFKGILKYFEPIMDGNLKVTSPFWYGNAKTTSGRKMFEGMEETITEYGTTVTDAQKHFMDIFRKDIRYMVEELDEAITAANRSNVERDMQRSQLNLGLMREQFRIGEKARLKLRKELAREAYSEGAALQMEKILSIKELKKIEGGAK